MTTAKETLKMFEDLDKQLDEIAVREEKVNLKQRMANQAQASADKQLKLANEAQSEADKLMSRFRAESARKEDEFRNRENTLVAKAADVERRILKGADDHKKREGEITRRTVAIEKRENACLEKERRLNEVSGEYTKLSDNMRVVLSKGFN